jgi:3-hydroxyisobutyrate dehydrogenase
MSLVPSTESGHDDRRVGLVGVGNMGGAMARRLLACGWQVRVHDIEPARAEALATLGAIACASAADAADGVDATIVCVVDAAECDAVLWGAGGLTERRGGLAGHAVLLCPTISPQDVERIAARLATMGADTLDAPMSGGPVRAAEGTMSLMVACPSATFETHRSLIGTLSDRVFRLGERPGDGARMKLVNNLLGGINLVGVAEALALAQRLGLDLGTALDVIEQSSGQSWVGSDRMRRAIVGDYAPRAHTTLLAKDTALAVQAGRAAGFEGPLGAAARDVFARALDAGLGSLDDAVLFRLLSEGPGSK